jgi:hypothetical protein
MGETLTFMKTLLGWHTQAHHFIVNLPERKVRHRVQRNPQPMDFFFSGCRGQMLKSFCLAASIFVLGAGVAHAIPISVISGTSGSFMPGQSYNETRAVEVTVLSPENLLVESMTLAGFNENGKSVVVGARIYDTSTHSLIASANANATAGPVTVPISAILVSGDEYSIGFFGDLGSATVFAPSSFPYTDSSGWLQIDGASESRFDAFPSSENIFSPQISLQASLVPERGNMATLGIGVFAILGFRRFAARRFASCA